MKKKLRGAILLANDILKKAKSDPVIITDESVAGMVRLIELELPPTEQIISGDERDDFSTLQTLIAEIKKLPEQKDALIQQTNEEVQRAVNSATLAQETEGAKQQVDLDQLPQQEIDASDIVPGPDGKLLQEQPDGSAVAKTVDGKEIKFNPGAVLAFLMIALLVDGDHTTRVIADQVSEGVSDYVMINFLGIDPDKVKSFVGHGEVSEQYLFFL